MITVDYSGDYFVMVQVVTNHILTHSQSFNFKLILQIKINSFI